MALVITNSVLNPQGRYGPEYQLTVSGLSPTAPTGHVLLVPASAIVDRKQRELIAPCAACTTPARSGFMVPTDERGSYLTRPQQAQPCQTNAVAPAGQVVVSACSCAACTCCTASLNWILNEAFARLNPGSLASLPTATATRIVGIGMVPGKKLDAQGATVDAPAQPATAVVLTATGNVA